MENIEFRKLLNEIQYLDTLRLYTLESKINKEFIRRKLIKKYQLK